MDPGSATTDSLDDPTGALFALAAAAGTEFPHLAEAREYTRDRLADVREGLRTLEAATGLSVVVFGSWARQEYTEHSDDDWAILVDGVPTDDPSVRDAQSRCEQFLGTDERKPGTQQIFGVPFSCDELVDRIGLDEDTNTNLTRRMLLLLESAGVTGAVHPHCVDRVLAAYLARGIKDHRPPRFLLNDLMRYWRTICVDFEGKHRASDAGDDPKWVSRNAKLRTSRKVLFAGGLLPVLLCHLKESSEMAAFLSAQLRAPATDRLAAAFLRQSAVAEGARALGAYDRWMRVVQDAESRALLAALRAGTREASPLFQEIREIGIELERGLLALLFETELSPLARQYGVF